MHQTVQHAVATNAHLLLFWCMIKRSAAPATLNAPLSEGRAVPHRCNLPGRSLITPLGLWQLTGAATCLLAVVISRVSRGASAGRTSSPAGVLTVSPPSTGLTPIDLAINNRHVKLVRRLEQRSFFSGWLLMKVPKYMGLGSEWKSRWCVIMPRYPNVSLHTCCTLRVPAM